MVGKRKNIPGNQGFFMNNDNIFGISEPEEPGEYWMEDDGGGPTLYVCEIKDGELCCGPKESRHRWPLEALRMESTIWKKAIKWPLS